MTRVVINICIYWSSIYTSERVERAAVIMMNTMRTISRLERKIKNKININDVYYVCLNMGKNGQRIYL